MSPDQDALALVAGIERASRRSRPFFLFGLLAVVLGFVSVSVYLYQDREEERAQKVVLERQVGELTATLNEARALWPSLDDSPAARERLRVLLGEASETARSLPAAVAEAETETRTEAPNATSVTPPPAARAPERPQRVGAPAREPGTPVREPRTPAPDQRRPQRQEAKNSATRPAGTRSGLRPGSPSLAKPAKQSQVRPDRG